MESDCTSMCSPGRAMALAASSILVIAKISPALFVAFTAPRYNGWDWSVATGPANR